MCLEDTLGELLLPNIFNVYVRHNIKKIAGKHQ
jgi:hypothetical protein